MLYRNLYHFLKKNFEIVGKTIYSHYLLDIVLSYSKIKVFIENQKNNLYKQYPGVQYSIEKAHRCVFIFYCFLYGVKYEPEYNEWSSLSKMVVFDPWISENSSTIAEVKDYQHMIIENYKPLNSQFENPYNDVLTFTDLNIYETKFVQASSKACKECLFIIKHKEKYSTFVINKNTVISSIIERTQIENPFFYINYRHKKMNTAINIELDRGYFLTGNQILSKTFVLRYLKYQSQPYYFDLNYEIYIMDKKMNYFTISSNEYIEFNEKGNIIVSFYTDTDTDTDTDK